jgi:WD40 repeat protein
MTFNGHVDIIVQVCFMSDNQILSSSEDQTVRLWELKGGRQVRCLKFGFAIKQIKISEDRCYMAG